jgi:hypothetical protein
LSERQDWLWFGMRCEVDQLTSGYLELAMRASRVPLVCLLVAAREVVHGREQVWASLHGHLAVVVGLAIANCQNVACAEAVSRGSPQSCFGGTCQARPCCLAAGQAGHSLGRQAGLEVASLLARHRAPPLPPPFSVGRPKPKYPRPSRMPAMCMGG